MDHVLYVYNYPMHLLYTHIPSIFDIYAVQSYPLCTSIILACCFLVKGMVKESRKTRTPKPADAPGKFDHFE
jgi:hypothetical protein